MSSAAGSSGEASPARPGAKGATAAELETPDTQLASMRLKVKKTVTSMPWELGMLVFVLVYFLVVFVTFALSDVNIARLICTTPETETQPANGWITEDCADETLIPLDTAFYVVDIIFLALFLVEIILKLFGIGLKYLKDVLNSADCVIIVASIFVTLLVMANTSEGSAAESTSNVTSLLPLFKVVRLLRVVLVMTRIQRSRERYRRMKMVGLAAPVEKVFEIITELRRKVVHVEDDKALAWTMDLIAKEELYKVNFTDSKNSSGMHLTAEMTDWLRSNLQARVPGGNKASSADGSAAGGADAKGPRGSIVPSGSKGNAKGGAPADDKEEKGAPKRRSSRFASAAIPSWITKAMAETSVTSVLEKMLDWDFDVFALHDATNGHPLTVGGMHLMMSMGVLDKIPIPKDKLATYLQAIERGYVSTNPFHNAVHASDVMFTTNYFLVHAPLLRDMTGPLDKFAAVLAAAVHDYAHPGLSNPFLVATRSEQATLYNDQSVLEMFHVAGSFRVMLSTPGCDVTEGMTREQFRQFRETMVSMVLATDLKVHFEHLGRMKTRVATDAYASVERKDVLLLLGQALHAADISNPTKIRSTMLRWTERVMKEFWMQGDKEASLGLPISAFMDRKQPQVQTCQMGFINVLVKPLYVEWHKLLGEAVQPGIDCLEGALKIWETVGGAPAAGWESEEFVR